MLHFFLFFLRLLTLCFEFISCKNLTKCFDLILHKHYIQIPLFYVNYINLFGINFDNCTSIFVPWCIQETFDFDIFSCESVSVFNLAFHDKLFNHI